MLNDQLYRKPDAENMQPRPVILEDGAVDAIVRTHLRLGHAGYQETFADLVLFYHCNFWRNSFLVE